MSKKHDDVFQDTQAKILLNTGLGIMRRQLREYELIDKMNPNEIKALNDLVKTLVSVDKNDRMSDLDEDLKVMETDDLNDLAKKAATDQLSVEELEAIIKSKKKRLGAK